ncbi:sensor histidine kinase [Paenibacillus sp. HJGM_3]|uniref:sensor histidine kinase n=1 Tax=Paenibacillus sp. HJGM_3 TaxID=3379816 RepID=UPI00385984B4
MRDPLSLWVIVKNYRFRSVFIKNFFIILALILLPITGLSVGIYNLYSKTVTEEISSAHLNALSRIRDMVDMMIREVDDFTVRLASDDNLKSLLEREVTGLPDYDMNLSIRKIYDELHTSNSIQSFVDSVYVYSEKYQYVLNSQHGRWPLDEFSDIGWLDVYKEKRPTANDWIFPRQARLRSSDTGGQELLTFVRTAPLLSSKKTGSVLFNIDTARFMDLINNANNHYIDQLYIIDGSGTVLASDDFRWINHRISDIIPDKTLMARNPNEPAFLYDEGSKQSISHVNSLYNNWKFISVVPLKLYEDKARYIRNYLFVSSLFSILVALILSLVISWKLFMPIKQIMAVVSRPGEWQDPPAGVTGRKPRLDEIKYITSNILHSFGEKKELENELRSRLALLDQAYQVALQSQINPHFLYNTLETINWQALRLSGGENPVSEMIAALSQLLRYSLEGEENLVPIRVEIEHCKSYIEIQRIRYPHKFEVEWHIDERIKAWKIPRISLQPLIENAIYHGIKPKQGAGKIVVTGTLEDEMAVLRIADDGVGVDRERVASMNAALSARISLAGTHIGMQNVNQRLKLTFGERSGLSMTSEPGVGTEVVIRIAAI